MPLVAAAGDLLVKILDGSYPLWGDGLTRSGYAQYNLAQQATRWGREHLDRVALVEGDRLLSSAKRYRLELMIDGRRCRALGIAAVFTPPERRGNGYGRMLLQQILEVAASDGYDAALLFSEIRPEYYARLGFVPVPQATLRLDVARKAGAPGIVVRQGDGRDIAHIARMNQDAASRHRLALVRTPEWIEYVISRKRLLAGLAPPGAHGVLFHVVEEGGRAVAYVVVTTSPGGWTLEECGDRDPSGARVGALLQLLLAREPAADAPPIFGWLPGGWLPPQLSIAARAAASQVMMIRPISDAGRIASPLAASDVLYWHADAF